MITQLFYLLGNSVVVIIVSWFAFILSIINLIRIEKMEQKDKIKSKGGNGYAFILKDAARPVGLLTDYPPKNKKQGDKNEWKYSVFETVIQACTRGDISLNNCLAIKTLLGGQEVIRPKYRDLIMSEEEYERRVSLGLIPSVEDVMNGYYKKRGG